MNSQFYFTTAPVYTSRRVERVPVGRREFLICYGDRISVKMTVGESKQVEYETRSVADMTDLIGDLRARARGARGLAVVSIRNHDRGWTRERRIMLYPQPAYVPAARIAAARPRAIMPWEH